MKQKLALYISFLAICYSLICLIIALFLPSSFNTSLDNALFPFGAIHLLIVFKRNKKYRLFIGLFGILFLWALSAEFIAKKTISIASLTYFLYFLKWPVLIFSFLDNSFVLVTKEKLFRVVDGVFISLVAINLFILFNPFGWGQALQLIYSPKSVTNFVYFNEIGTFRLSGTCMDPNNNGAIFGSFLFFYLFLREKETWMYIVIALFIVLMTQSRTVFLGIALISIIWIIYKFFQQKNLKKYFIILLISFVSVFFIVLSSANLRSLFSGEAFVSNSLFIRMNSFSRFLEDNDFNQFYGMGWIEQPFLRLGFYLDSELIALLFQFGIVGLLIWTTLFIYATFLFKINGKRSQFWIAYLLFLMIVSVSNFTLLNSQFGIIISVFLGLGLLLEEKYRSIRAKKNPATEP